MFTSQDIRNNKIKEMYDSGMTLLQIADKLGLTKIGRASCRERV